jgi:hypothetical protein
LLGAHVSRFEVVDAKDSVVERSYILIDEVRPINVHGPGAIVWRIETIDPETIGGDFMMCRFLVQGKIP